MSDFAVFLPFLIFFFVFISIITNAFSTARKASQQNNRQTTNQAAARTARDNQVYQQRLENEVSCETQYGHDHRDERRRLYGNQKIEQGYVILNGVKRRLRDCSKL